MRVRQGKNIAASIRMRLLQISKNQKVDFNRILLLYVHERFLYRLMHSKFKDNFILKGGVLFYGMHRLNARQTKDIDFLVKGLKNEANELEKIIAEIVTKKIEDGLLFDESSLSVEEISGTAEYHGLRLRLLTFLEQARINLQLDLGFGDVIFPKQISFEYPSMLEDENFKINAYSWESVISEKFEAIVKLSDINSRMKDFYDLYFLIYNHIFDGKNLGEAISKTFKNRDTNLKNYT